MLGNYYYNLGDIAEIYIDFCKDSAHIYPIDFHEIMGFQWAELDASL